MGLESGTYVNDFVTTNPVSGDNVSQGDDHIRLLKTLLKTTFPNASKAFRFPEAREITATGDILSTDDNGIVLGNGASGNITLTLPSLVAGDEGWSVTVVNMHATNDTIVAPPSGTISGSSTITLDVQYTAITVRWTGSAFVWDQDYVAAATKARLDNITANRLLGRYSTGGAFQEITIGSGLTLGAGPELSAVAVLPRGYIDGCIMSNNSGDATNDIDIAAGVCRDSTNTVNITVAAATKQLDANWVAGTTGGMRNSGAGIANTTYHIYAVSKADGTSGIYAHTSLTVATVITALQAETGGADYLYARRIGSIVRSGATILGFVQFGNEFRYKSPILDVNGASQTTTSALRALTVPLGLKVQAIANVRAVSASASAATIYITSPDVTDEDPSLTAAPLSSATVSATSVSGVGIGLKFKEYVNTSGEWRFDTPATVTLYVATLGWEDSRGRDA